METLVAVSRCRGHRYQYYGRAHSPAVDCFAIASSPPRGLKGINCRDFYSGAGVLPRPPSSFSYCSPTPSARKPSLFHSEPPKQGRRSAPIPISAPRAVAAQEEEVVGVFGSELWAGPAYSNSPPPSSLPLPNFSLRQKRSISFELPRSDYVVETRVVSKSAPSSPTREMPSSPFANSPFFSTASATQDLCRILNLDMTGD